MADDYVYPHVERYAKNGSILGLGCGPGAVGNELNAAAYHFYTGVDISDVAIEKTRIRTAQNRRTEKNEYFQSDILSYIPKR
jgi:predicted TPR repeat methyltransferase